MVSRKEKSLNIGPERLSMAVMVKKIKVNIEYVSTPTSACL